MDGMTKILLALIAGGLWANTLRPAIAQDPGVATIATSIEQIADGRCRNTTLCPGQFGRPGGFGSP